LTVSYIALASIVSVINGKFAFFFEDLFDGTDFNRLSRE
jgi:hypothetical protein